MAANRVMYIDNIIAQVFNNANIKIKDQQSKQNFNSKTSVRK